MTSFMSLSDRVSAFLCFWCYFSVGLAGVLSYDYVPWECIEIQSLCSFVFDEIHFIKPMHCRPFQVSSYCSLDEPMTRKFMEEKTANEDSIQVCRKTQVLITDGPIDFLGFGD